MKSSFLILLFSTATYFFQAQNDTLYVKFKESDFSSISEINFIKISDSIDTTIYPFEMNRSYDYQKQFGNFLESISFFYFRNPPDWSSTPFMYRQISKKQLRVY